MSVPAGRSLPILATAPPVPSLGAGLAANALCILAWMQRSEGWGSLGKANAILYLCAGGLVLTMLSLGAWGFCRRRRGGRPGLWLAAAGVAALPPLATLGVVVFRKLFLP